MIRVVVVAPALAVRAGLRALLGTGTAVEVIAEAATVSDLLPLPSGTDVLVWVTQVVSRADHEKILRQSDTPSVLLLGDVETEAAQFLAGLPLRACGFLPLDASAEEMLAAVRALHEGLLVGAPALIEPLLAHFPHAGEAESESLVEPLTERESEVLQLLAQGLANKQIALSLGISEHTVKFHVSAIYAKMGATNRTEAVRLGVRRGLVVL